SLLSRTPTTPGRLSATSTQLPSPWLRRAFRHRAPETSRIDVLLHNRRDQLLRFRVTQGQLAHRVPRLGVWAYLFWSIEIERPGQTFAVDGGRLRGTRAHRRKIQNDEWARHRHAVGPPVRGDNPQRHPRFDHGDEVLELIAPGLGVENRPPQHHLVENDLEFRRSGPATAQHFLPLHPQRHSLLDLAIADIRGGACDRRGVLPRLEQAGHHGGLVVPKPAGRPLHADVELEPTGDDLAVRVPPAARLRLLGECDEDLRLLGGHAVHVAHGNHIVRAHHILPALDSVHLRPGPLQLRSGGFEADPRLLTSLFQIAPELATRHRGSDFGHTFSLLNISQNYEIA